jgi:hypothetical protein
VAAVSGRCRALSPTPDRFNAGGRRVFHRQAFALASPRASPSNEFDHITGNVCHTIPVTRRCVGDGTTVDGRTLSGTTAHHAEDLCAWRRPIAFFSRLWIFAAGKNAKQRAMVKATVG